MAETVNDDTATSLEMLAVEYDNDGRLADLEVDAPPIATAARPIGL